MPYANICDVATEFKGIEFDADSGVKPDTVEKFLEQDEAFIHTYIGERYTTPVTSTEGIEVLKKIEVQLVAFRIDKILDLTGSRPVPKAGIIQSNDRAFCYKEAIDYLKSIRDNKMNLPGTDELVPDAGLASFHTEPGNSDIVPLFDKEEQQW